MRQYRVKETTGEVPTFTPQYSDNAGTTWNTIGSTTSLTKAGAEQFIDAFIKADGKNVNEIFHAYGLKIIPLYD